MPSRRVMVFHLAALGLHLAEAQEAGLIDDALTEFHFGTRLTLLGLRSTLRSRTRHPFPARIKHYSSLNGDFQLGARR